MRQRTATWLGLLLLFQLVAMVMVPVQAESDDAFVVESAGSVLRDRVYFLNAVFAIRLPDYIISAVDQGFELPLVLEVEVYRQRSFWFDAEIVHIRQLYRINHLSLLDSVSVLDVNSGLRRLYPDLEDAMESLTVVLDQPLLDRSTLQDDQLYTARLRLGIDHGTLPLPLKSTSFWDNDWSLVSEWYEWEMTP
jgi:hypothetical protein